MGAPAVGDIVVRKSFPPLSRATLALYAGASGDLNPVHIDQDFARAAGFPDVFAQGMLVMAYLGQALGEFASPPSIRSFATRFVSMTELGDAIECTGRVADVHTADGERLMRIDLVAENASGAVRLAGTAVVAI